MNEALLRNLTDQELVRYAGQQLPPELYSRLVTLFDEREEDISTIEQLQLDNDRLDDLEDARHRMKLAADSFDRNEIDEITAFDVMCEILEELEQ